MKPTVSFFSNTVATVNGKPLSIEETCAYAARVSNPSNQHNHETSTRLLNFCMREHHWSVFEMADITLSITTTRDIARQMLRHRSFGFQEFSQRYADPTKMGLVTGEARLQDTKNRQNSISDGIDKTVVSQWSAKQQQLNHETMLAYRWAVENGIALECARKILPEGNTPSTLFMKGSLRSWIHYIDIRYADFTKYKQLLDNENHFEQIVTDNGTQKEHKEVAGCAAQVIGEIVPFIHDRYFS